MPVSLTLTCDRRPPQQGTASTGVCPQPGRPCSHQPAPGSLAFQAPCSQACRTSKSLRHQPPGMSPRLAWSPDVHPHLLQQSRAILQLPLLVLQVSRLPSVMSRFVDMQSPCAVSCHPVRPVQMQRCRGCLPLTQALQSAVVAAGCHLVHPASPCRLDAACLVHSQSTACSSQCVSCTSRHSSRPRRVCSCAQPPGSQARRMPGRDAAWSAAAGHSPGRCVPRPVQGRAGAHQGTPCPGHTGSGAVCLLGLQYACDLLQSSQAVVGDHPAPILYQGDVFCGPWPLGWLSWVADGQKACL